MKITQDKELLAKYKASVGNNNTNNIFVLFIDKAISLGDVISLIVPKSLINTSEFNKTRALMAKYQIERIIDLAKKVLKA